MPMISTLFVTTLLSNRTTLIPFEPRAHRPKSNDIDHVTAVDLIGQVASEDRYGGMMVTEQAAGQPGVLRFAPQVARSFLATALGGAAFKIVPT